MGHGAHGRVVTTLTCSACIAREASRLGCDVTSVSVGFARVYREMLEADAIMGVEEYGGICVPAHLRERDGLLVFCSRWRCSRVREGRLDDGPGARGGDRDHVLREKGPAP